MQLRKIWLNINGADRMLVCDPEKDTLATVIRRLGLTGTKVGCGAGQCGACSIILNGRVVRSCSRKIKDIEEYSEIITIEGIGSPRNLHPLQQAWITYGGVQCGFCSSGFIVSAFALLGENINPSRQDVRDWFQRHRNICRCTGYKPLVDAVMAAAKVMRGEASMADITYQGPANGDYYGDGVPRPSALARVCGTEDYGDDIALKMPSGTLHAAVVQPKVFHHANIKGIDFSEAEKMPGVYKIITAKDIQGTNRLEYGNSHRRSAVAKSSRPIINGEKIFRWGDVVAVVCADTHENARKAADAVKVDLEPLPEYLSYLDAVMPDAVRVDPDVPNLFMQQPILKGDYEGVADIIGDAAYSVSGSWYTTREPHLSIEGDVIQSYWDEDGNLAVHCKSQGFSVGRKAMAPGIGIELDKLRYVLNPNGGSFGWSMSPGSFALAAAATMATDMPVSLSMSYEEHQHYSGKRCPAYTNGAISCDGNGRITAIEYESGVDHGAYSDSGEGLIARFIRYMGWPYNVPNIKGLARMANTNHNFGIAYRAYGSPQVFLPSESMMDMLAEEAGIDPFEFRYINIARSGDTNTNSMPYREYPMEQIMDTMRPIYEKALAEAKASDTPEIRRGVGLAFGGYNCTGGKKDFAHIDLELNADGTFTHYNTWQDMGQGGDVGGIMHALEALKPLGVAHNQIKVRQNDTSIAPDSGSSATSRSHIMVGLATIDAANKLMDAMRKDDGTYRTYEEMAAEGIPTKYRGTQDNAGIEGLADYDPNTGVGEIIPTYMYGIFLSEVEVDVATGKTKVIGMTIVCDIGKVGNRLSVEGQAYGGMSHSIGFALTENYEDVKRHGTIAGAGIPTINEIPDKMDLICIDSHRDFGPFGSSGCSELFQSSGHAAVINAIKNACGVRIYELPASPNKVKAGLDILANGGVIEPPAPYYMGSDFYDEMEDIIANPVPLEGERLFVEGR